MNDTNPEIAVMIRRRYLAMPPADRLVIGDETRRRICERFYGELAAVVFGGGVREARLRRHHVRRIDAAGERQREIHDHVFLRANAFYDRDVQICIVFLPPGLLVIGMNVHDRYPGTGARDTIFHDFLYRDRNERLALASNCPVRQVKSHQVRSAFSADVVEKLAFARPRKFQSTLPVFRARANSGTIRHTLSKRAHHVRLKPEPLGLHFLLAFCLHENAEAALRALTLPPQYFCVSRARSRGCVPAGSLVLRRRRGCPPTVW
jgi:hypothetical protein